MGKWISVKDKLPEIGKMILVTGFDYGIGLSRHYHIAQLKNDGFYEMDDSCYTYKLEYIDHWIDCPEFGE